MIRGSADPGIRVCGCAISVGSRLYAADYVKNPVEKGNDIAAIVGMGRAAALWFAKHCPPGRQYDEFVFEYPRMLDPSHQKGSKQKIDLNDLPPLVGVDAAIAMAFPYLATSQFHTYFPNEWKNQVEKLLMNKRVWAQLGEEERARVVRHSKGEPGGKIGLDHNTLDAVGIVLKHIGRLERYRSLPA